VCIKIPNTYPLELLPAVSSAGVVRACRESSKAVSAGFRVPVRLGGTQALRRCSLPLSCPSERVVRPDIVLSRGLRQLRLGQSPSHSCEISASSQCALPLLWVAHRASRLGDPDSPFILIEGHPSRGGRVTCMVDSRRAFSSALSWHWLPTTS
jgi:hypothetical protein